LLLAFRLTVHRGAWGVERGVTLAFTPAIDFGTGQIFSRGGHETV
jgi:hypothetical protein